MRPTGSGNGKGCAWGHCVRGRGHRPPSAQPFDLRPCAGEGEGKTEIRNLTITMFLLSAAATYDNLP